MPTDYWPIVNNVLGVVFWLATAAVGVLTLRRVRGMPLQIRKRKIDDE